MFGKISHALMALAAAGLLGGCNSSSPVSGLTSGQNDSAQPAAVVQAFCPPIIMREQTAVHRAYARGGEGDAAKLLYQASFGDLTRQCTANETTLTINLVAQGRIVQGPAGQPGQVTLPVLIELVDDSNVIHSERIAFAVEVPAGGGQFFFTKPDLQLPNAVGGISRFTRVRIGFDTPAARPARR